MNNSKIASNIRNLRLVYGETQEELGRAINVENNTISMYESGNRQPDLQMLHVIAEHYGVLVDEIMNSDLFDVNPFDTLISISIEHSLAIVQSMFPFVKSDEALQEPHFAKAYELTEKLLYSLNQEVTTWMNLIFMSDHLTHRA